MSYLNFNNIFLSNNNQKIALKSFCLPFFAFKNTREFGLNVSFIKFEFVAKT